jgi:hypothetical protein
MLLITDLMLSKAMICTYNKHNPSKKRRVNDSRVSRLLQESLVFAEEFPTKVDFVYLGVQIYLPCLRASQSAVLYQPAGEAKVIRITPVFDFASPYEWRNRPHR